MAEEQTVQLQSVHDVAKDLHRENEKRHEIAKVHRSTIEAKVDKVLHHVGAMHHTVKVIGWTVGILVMVGIVIGWWL